MPRDAGCRAPRRLAGAERAEPVEPPQDVAAAVPPRQPRMAANRERHLTARLLDLVGELHPGRRGADDEDAAGGQLSRDSCTVRSNDLQNATGRAQLLIVRARTAAQRARWRSRPPPRVPRAARRLQRESRVPRGDPRAAPSSPARAACADRVVYASRNVTSSAADMKPSGSSPSVLKTRQPRHPVRREEPHRVPAVAAPPLPHASAIEHDVLDPAVGQAAAHRQTRLSGADDHRLPAVTGTCQFTLW